MARPLKGWRKRKTWYPKPKRPPSRRGTRKSGNLVRWKGIDASMREEEKLPLALKLEARYLRALGQLAKDDPSTVSPT